MAEEIAPRGRKRRSAISSGRPPASCRSHARALLSELAGEYIASSGAQFKSWNPATFKGTTWKKITPLTKVPGSRPGMKPTCTAEQRGQDGAAKAGRGSVDMGAHDEGKRPRPLTQIRGTTNARGNPASRSCSYRGIVGDAGDSWPPRALENWNSAAFRLRSSTQVPH